MSEELKPCPFCGGEAELNRINTAAVWAIEVRCPHCGCGTDCAEMKAEAIAAWNRRAEPDIGITITDHIHDIWEMVKHIEIEGDKNAPLTLDELRGMDGEPVYCLDLNCEVKICAPRKGLISVLYNLPGISGVNYAREFTLYRRKPEGVRGNERTTVD